MDYSYHPDKWCIVKIVTERETLYKVLGTWFGGYLYGDSWRMNSGIEKVAYVENHYYIYGYSGSVYKCHEDAYGYGMVALGIFDELKEKYGAEMLHMEDKQWQLS